MQECWRLILAKNRSSVLKVLDLSVSYGFISALRNVSVELFAGEFVALIGANGAGKSTFLEAILGMHRAALGRIFFLGEEITHKTTDRIVALGIALCPEGRGILPLMSVLENLQLGAFHHREFMQEGLSRVSELFPILWKRKDQAAGTLSGGEQQMLSIGRALMASPRLLMLDEPSLGLAPLVINELFRIIGDLAGDSHTILLAEQNAKKALQYSKRGYVFETGRIVLEGSAQELANNDAVIRVFVGGRAEH
jgi:branched-chain amino acid transport system ATP-binding protein